MKKGILILAVLIISFVILLPSESHGQILRISDQVQLTVDFAFGANFLAFDGKVASPDNSYDFSFLVLPTVGVGLHVAYEFNNFTLIGVNFFPSVSSFSTEVNNVLTRFTSINLVFGLQLFEFASIGYGYKILFNTSGEIYTVPTIVVGAVISFGYISNFIN